ncbi:hypothetical protein QR297_07525 [Pseudomonas shirazica]|uniref:TniQ protein n=1 Tax=Pseudomonas shirazica TaxID=1940636 RepID=A0ABY9SUG0_9PSED|nr:hypothetical protein [Pseudomonas shirazica]WMY86707.1 hypothetical protein QR297_07525 [Pseudomonas shirazica]
MHSLTNEQVLAIIHENPINRALLAALPALDIPHCMLTAGALFQTFWNYRAKLPSERGIKGSPSQASQLPQGPRKTQKLCDHCGSWLACDGRKAAPNWLTDRHYPRCLTIGTSTERRLV